MLCSIPAEKLLVPTPRMVRPDALLLRLCLNRTLGSISDSCWGWVMFIADSASPRTAVMARGTSCTFSARFWAVTMISSMVMV
jgi:hypothetical protein